MRPGADMAWKSPAFVGNCHGALASLPDEVRDVISSPSQRSSQRPQARILAALRPSDPESSLIAELVCRLRWWRFSNSRERPRLGCGVRIGRADTPRHPQVCARLSHRLGPHCRQRLVTSARRHGGRDLCLFGCHSPEGVANSPSASIVEIGLACQIWSQGQHWRSFAGID